MQEAVPKYSILFEKHAGNFAASWNLLHVEEILEWQSSDSSAIPPSSQTPDDCAMILFTSGTTGVPKGVLMPNRQIAGYAVTMAEAYRYNRDSRIFAFASYAFDVFISDVFGGLSAGAVLCIAALDSTMDDLVGLLNVSRSTHINLTSSVASMLDPRKLAYLQSVVLTGEPATKKLFQTWASRIHVVNSYGKISPWPNKHISLSQGPQKLRSLRGPMSTPMKILTALDKRSVVWR
jgi:non-ribosomal peptide synthetase component F